MSCNIDLPGIVGKLALYKKDQAFDPKVTIRGCYYATGHQLPQVIAVDEHGEFVVDTIKRFKLVAP